MSSLTEKDLEEYLVENPKRIESGILRMVYVGGVPFWAESRDLIIETFRIVNNFDAPYLGIIQGDVHE